MDLSDIRDLIADDFQATDRLIVGRLQSDVALINQIGSYIVHSGGKRLRPMIVLLTARALGYRGKAHIDLAAIVEFIHTATLLHDDVVDDSEQRRSRDTANNVWGNAASVLVGDFLYSRAFEMMVDVGSMPVMAVMALATNRIAEGEVLQLLNCNDPDTDETRYRDVIERKTATLFQAGARIAAIASDAEPSTQQAMADYGLHLGMAFQMIDDALDYGASDADIGKNLGDDLAEGKPTLPLIHAMAHSDDATRATLRRAIETGGGDSIGEVLAAIESAGSIQYTARLAAIEADKARQALAILPESPYRQALTAVADFAVARKF
jgi:octaprenyl-diphosphate synthase